MQLHVEAPLQQEIDRKGTHMEDAKLLAALPPDIQALFALAEREIWHFGNLATQLNRPPLLQPSSGSLLPLQTLIQVCMLSRNRSSSNNQAIKGKSRQCRRSARAASATAMPIALPEQHQQQQQQQQKLHQQAWQFEEQQHWQQQP